jgi:exosortase
VRGDWFRRHPALLVAVHAACFWPVWRWYFQRLNDGSDEPWAIAALVAAVFMSWPARGFRLDARDPLLAIAAVLTLMYAVLAPVAPPLVRAIPAMAALACCWVSVTGSRHRLPAIVGLLLLSIPVISSLQFYAGYPLRIVTAAGATEMLNLFGFEVARVGTSMSVDGRTVLVDAPCSGVRMLWTGSVLCCVLAAIRDARWRSTVTALLLVVPVVLFVNGVRAALLFLLETRTTPPPSVAHSLVGVATFVLAAGLLMWSDVLQRRFTESPHRSRVRLSAGAQS